MSEIVNYSNLEHLDIAEEDGQYSTTIVFNREKFLEIQKENIDLREGANIKKENKLKKTLNRFTGREYMIYFRKTCVENTINIEDTDGSTSLPLIILDNRIQNQKMLF